MSRAILKRAIQWSLTIGSAFLILRVIDLRTIPYIIASANKFNLLLAFFIAMAHFFVGAWRWRNLIRLYGIEGVSYVRLCNLYIASFFVSSILPGTITGDGLRVYETRHDLHDTPTALAIVLLERLLGIILLMIIGLIAWILIPIHPLLQFTIPHMEYVLILLVMASMLLGLGAMFWRTSLTKMYQWVNNLLQVIIQLPALIYARPLIAAKVLVGSIIYLFLSILIIFESLHSTGVPISLQVFLTVVPVITLLLILPISVQGIGVRESLYLAFLTPYGLSSEPIIAGLALTYVIGVPFILWGWVLFSRMSHIQPEIYRR